LDVGHPSSEGDGIVSDFRERRSAPPPSWERLKGHLATRARPRNHATKAAELRQSSGKSSAPITRQLATLLDAGVRSSADCAPSSNRKKIARSKMFRQTHADVEGGSQLSEALARHPKVFDKLLHQHGRRWRNGWKCSETSLVRLADFMAAFAEDPLEIKSAMFYPAAKTACRIWEFTHTDRKIISPSRHMTALPNKHRGFIFERIFSETLHEIGQPPPNWFQHSSRFASGRPC